MQYTRAMPKLAPEGQKNVMVRMPASLHAEMEERARAEDINISQLVRRAVRRYLEDGYQPLRGLTASNCNCVTSQGTSEP